MMSKTPAIMHEKPQRLRSFVRRDSRRTPAQERAHQAMWPLYGLCIEQGARQPGQIFGREAPCFLEIGFGSGQSLLALAQSHPDKHFIGVETHKPGIGAVCLGIQLNQLTNLRLYYQDAVDVLEQAIVNDSLDGVQIFFPDPWQKRRHHARRLIQPDFVRLVVSKLKKGGTLHLATDWDDYAKHMMRIVTAEASLKNLAGVGQFGKRSIYRPILTKFEQRAMREGRKIWELQLEKI